MNITEIVNSFPEYAKDIKLNYAKVLNEEVSRKNNITSFSIQTIARIASIINSIANIIRVIK